MTTQTPQPHLRAVPMSLSLYPTFGSLQEVIDLAHSKLPLTQKNDIVVLFNIYHNTLLSIQAGDQP